VTIFCSKEEYFMNTGKLSSQVTNVAASSTQPCPRSGGYNIWLIGYVYTYIELKNFTSRDVAASHFYHIFNTVAIIIKRYQLQRNTIALCAINFKIFEKLMSKIKDMEAVLLFSKIKYESNQSKYGYIARTRKKLGSWFGYNEKKVDRLLKILEDKKFIKKEGCSFWGVRKLRITVLYACDHVPINFKILNHLYSFFDSIKASILFSKISFTFNKTSIAHEGKRWCALSKTDLAQWSGLDISTVRTLIKSFVKKGFILDKQFEYKGRFRSHFHLTAPALDILLHHPVYKNNHELARLGKVIHTRNSIEKEVIHTQIPQGKISIPIRKRTNDILENNITVIEKQKKAHYHKQKISTFCDINLNKISPTSLNTRQKKYLVIALERTYARKKFHRSNFKTIKAEVEYFILNATQRVGVSTFKHAVNRAMKILSDKCWCTPFGFHKYSDKGIVIAEKIKNRESEWERVKEGECQRELKSKHSVSHINSLLGQTNTNPDEGVQKNAESILKQIKSCQRDKNTNQVFSVARVKTLLERLYGLLNHGLDYNWLRIQLKRIV
jgi:DNA-binding MarR family transcriptional regulator